MPVCCGVFENYVSERISKAERIASDSWEGQEVSQRHAEVFNLLVKGLSEAQKKLLMEWTIVKKTDTKSEAIKEGEMSVF